MQQPALLLDISDLPPIDSLDAEDIQQLTACIELCRSHERPELAAPYAMQLCEYHNHYNEIENSFWFDAITADDLFLAKALVAAGFDINETYEYTNEDDDSEFGAAITLALAHNSQNTIVYLLNHPEINLNIVGYILSDYSHPTLAQPKPKNNYIVPILMLYQSRYSDYLDKLSFDVDIRWGITDTWSALKTAVMSYDLTLTQWLLSHHSDPNQLTDDDSDESLFGWLINEYINQPTPEKLSIITLMFEYGASTSATNWEGFPVLNVVWQEKNQILMDLFNLSNIQDEFAELEQVKTEQIEEIAQLKHQLDILNNFEEHAKYNHARPREQIEGENVHYRAPNLKISILNELRINCPFAPAGWITELAIIQQDETIGLYIEQQEAQIAAITIMLPAEISYLSYPFTSSIAMGLHFIQCPANWWLEVEQYLQRFHITLTDPLFFETRRNELEHGY